MTFTTDDDLIFASDEVLDEQMKLNKLQGAIRVCDRELLRSAIKDYDDHGGDEAGHYAAYDEDDDEGVGDGVVTSEPLMN